MGQFILEKEHIFSQVLEQEPFEGKTAALNNLKPLKGPPVTGYCIALEVKAVTLRINPCQKSWNYSILRLCFSSRTPSGFSAQTE